MTDSRHRILRRSGAGGTRFSGMRIFRGGDRRTRHSLGFERPLSPWPAETTLFEEKPLYSESYRTAAKPRDLPSLPFFIADGYAWHSDSGRLGITTGTLVVGAKVENPDRLVLMSLPPSSTRVPRYTEDPQLLSELLAMSKWVWADPAVRLIPVISEPYND
eukprot:Gregarina_sp_Poly_1__7608@NODE_426_length_8588_cov_216_941204_g347_i0_p7_GENE_NODE_426_length_8588_cov_216_941204_g347_i0NODE_426_length_8588_cov_216_941204_g347_i0_p7_ORF_typecomplete_len161_score15_69_NODE_426_length_8588_cov_216_941204_g347_i070647546